MALLAGVANIRAASPKSSLRQQQVQLGQRINRGSRGAQSHASAGRGVQHPSSDHDHDAWFDLNVNYLAVGALLAVLAPDATPIKRVPAVKDFNLLPDMGRMTR
ncbi:MAG: hypothetical protein Q7U73_12955 [Rubrivivax sp.]|nr:hypothetical protein [Rubrivivax sp.]